jgi:hypothetical protein
MRGSSMTIQSEQPKQLPMIAILPAFPSTMMYAPLVLLALSSLFLCQILAVGEVSMVS